MPNEVIKICHPTLWGDRKMSVEAPAALIQELGRKALEDKIKSSFVRAIGWELSDADAAAWALRDLTGDAEPLEPAPEADDHGEQHEAANLAGMAFGPRGFNEERGYY